MFRLVHPTRWNAFLFWMVPVAGIFCLIGIFIGIITLVSISSGQIVQVGQTITLHGLSATLTGVGGALSYDTPAPGQPEEVAAHIKIVNNAGSEQAYSPLMFHVKSGAGTITGPQLIAPSFYQADDLLGNGMLVPGGSVEGDVIVQVTVGDKQAEVTWQPTEGDSDSANGWVLALQD